MMKGEQRENVLAPINMNRTQCVTTCRCTSVSCEWRTSKEPFGPSTRWSSTSADLKGPLQGTIFKQNKNTNPTKNKNLTIAHSMWTILPLVRCRSSVQFGPFKIFSFPNFLQQTSTMLVWLFPTSSFNRYSTSPPGTRNALFFPYHISIYISFNISLTFHSHTSLECFFSSWFLVVYIFFPNLALVYLIRFSNSLSELFVRHFFFLFFKSVSLNPFYRLTISTSKHHRRVFWHKQGSNSFRSESGS